MYLPHVHYSARFQTVLSYSADMQRRRLKYVVEACLVLLNQLQTILSCTLCVNLHSVDYTDTDTWYDCNSVK